MCLSPPVDESLWYFGVARHATALLVLCLAGCPHFGHHDHDRDDADVAPERDAAVDSGAAADGAVDAEQPDAELADGGRDPDDASVDAQPAPSDTGVTDAEVTPEPDAAADGGQPDAGGEPSFALRVVTQGLAAPLELRFGPDDRLWVTERIGKRVLRVDPTSGAVSTALNVADAHQSGGQDGVLGFAFHPGLLQGRGTDYVYLAYTYDADPGSALDRRTKIVRYRYDASSEGLVEPLPLITGLLGSVDHNSGRLVYGPDEKLYYTIGDQGNNQFDRKCLPIRAQELPLQAEVDQQDWSRYVGKVLRLNLDGSIPSDNPLLAGVRSHVYSYGHRNAQGLAFGPDGKLYEDEHGPKTDDEVNLISSGKNYGWPQVAGYQDDKAYVYGNWSASSPVPCSELAFSDYVLPPSVPVQRESDWTSPDFTPPLATFYTVENDHNFMDPACAGNEYICWPTIAPSSLEVYVPTLDGIPRWGTSLLVTSLKQGSVFRLRLNAEGTAVAETTRLFKTTNRYRDLTIAPDNTTFYIITDSSGTTGGPTGGFTSALEHLGAILEFRYTP